MRILLVEDDQMLGDGLRVGLKQQGYAVDWVQEGESVESALANEPFDLMVLDINLPGIDGITLLKGLREQGNDIPVLLLTARDTVADRIDGLDSGADDYLVKPFDMEELVARLRALGRRRVGRATPSIIHGDIEMDPAAHRVTKAGEPIELSSREFAIFQSLLESVGQVLSRTRLEEKLYGWDDLIESNAIEVYIHHLRKKLGKSTIRTVRGVGYMIEKEKS